MSKYKSDVELGGRYRDDQTGFEGTAVVISFHQHSCERVVIESKASEAGEIKFYEFDAARLSLVAPPAASYEKPDNGAVTGTVVQTGRRP